MLMQNSKGNTILLEILPFPLYFIFLYVKFLQYGIMNNPCYCQMLTVQGKENIKTTWRRGKAFLLERREILTRHSTMLAFDVLEYLPLLFIHQECYRIITQSYI